MSSSSSSSSSISSTSPPTINNIHTCETHLSPINNISLHPPMSSINNNNQKRKIVSVDALAESLAQKRLKQQFQEFQQPQPMQAKRDDKFNIKNLFKDSASSPLNGMERVAKNEHGLNISLIKNSPIPLDLTKSNKKAETNFLSNNNNIKTKQLSQQMQIVKSNETLNNKPQRTSLKHQQQSSESILQSSLPSFAALNPLLNQQAALAALTASLFTSNAPQSSFTGNNNNSNNNSCNKTNTNATSNSLAAMAGALFGNPSLLAAAAAAMAAAAASNPSSSSSGSNGNNLTSSNNKF